MHGNIGDFEPKPRRPTLWQRIWRRVLAILAHLFDEAFRASAEWNETMFEVRGRSPRLGRERLWPP